MEKLAESLGVTKLSKSQVSVMAAELNEMAAELNEIAASFRSRPPDAGPYAFTWTGALPQKAREGARVPRGGSVLAGAGRKRDTGAEEPRIPILSASSRTWAANGKPTSHQRVSGTPRPSLQLEA